MDYMGNSYKNNILAVTFIIIAFIATAFVAEFERMSFINQVSGQTDFGFFELFGPVFNLNL